jgi:hypothetical protein
MMLFVASDGEDENPGRRATTDVMIPSFDGMTGRRQRHGSIMACAFVLAPCHPDML